MVGRTLRNGILMILLVGSPAASQTPCEFFLDFVTERPALSAVRPATPSRTSVRFVVIGDFGDQESDGQLAKESQQVLAAIHAKHRATPFDFALTVGDNFYPRGTPTLAVLQRRWKPFTSLGIPFFASLGNHDYFRGRARIQVLYDTSTANVQSGHTWRMPCRYYTVNTGPVQFAALDTDEGTLGIARRIRRLLTLRFSEESWSDAQTSWLERRLEASTSPWTIVYGHHPVFSRGTHGDTARLQKVRPGRPSLYQLLVQHKVAAYIAGHDHSLQLTRSKAVDDSNGVDFLVVGAGGRDTTPVNCRTGDAECERLRNTLGFLTIDASTTSLTYEFFGATGASLLKWERTR